MPSSAWDDTQILANSVKAALVRKVFDTMISPILTYNSEIWGVYTKPGFETLDGSQIDKTHLQFCKRYLEVNNKASQTYSL